MLGLSTFLLSSLTAAADAFNYGFLEPLHKSAGHSGWACFQAERQLDAVHLRGGVHVESKAEAVEQQGPMVRIGIISVGFTVPTSSPSILGV